MACAVIVSALGVSSIPIWSQKFPDTESGTVTYTTSTDFLALTVALSPIKS